MQNHIFFAVLVLLTTLLTACMTLPVDDPNACGALEHQNLIGQPKSTVIDLGLYDTSRVADASLPGDEDAVWTADLVPTRMNIRIDKAGNVTSITCG